MYFSLKEQNLLLIQCIFHQSTVDQESFVAKKIRTFDNVRKLITQTLLHMEIFTVGIFTVYNAHVMLWCYSV